MRLTTILKASLSRAESRSPGSFRGPTHPAQEAFWAGEWAGAPHPSTGCLPPGTFCRTITPVCCPHLRPFPRSR